MICASALGQEGRPLKERDYRIAPFVLSENVQRIAKEEEIWLKHNFSTVESYVDFLTFTDQIAKRRFATQMLRKEGGADIDEEYRITFAILCFIPIPGKPPRYPEKVVPVRTTAPVLMFTSAQARRNLEKIVKPAVYEMPAEEFKKGIESPEQFFDLGAQ
jgi:hypothetical protein